MAPKERNALQHWLADHISLRTAPEQPLLGG